MHAFIIKRKIYHNINANILDANFGENVYDVVVIRGAIEHFSADNQQLIFCKSNRALKEGGVFCGDTVQKIENVCQLKEHKCEWENEEAMRKALAAVFEDITTYSFESKKGDHDVKGRVTLLWSCRKHMNSI
jgi:cyclopropane fatty-acyl-phospholipid synthase-like methyltransferase